jgi:transglutaminase-like putative cysteine protease
MDRRRFLKTAGLAATLASPLATFAARAADAPPEFAPSPANGWRTFEVVGRVDVARPGSAVKVWLPVPAVHEAEWIRPLGNLWETNADSARIVADPRYGAAMLAAEWSSGAVPTLELTSRFATRDRAVAFAKPSRVAPLSAHQRALWTAPTEFLPTDGIVRATALDITRGCKGDEAKARAIYAWIVDNAVRNPATRGCGVGDIRGMLEAGNLAGKCADLNGLYVGLARAAGLPARDVYGIRVADSRFGYKSLGKSGTITKAQHCRAEVWLAAHGWVPVDPADVRKVILEEPPGKLARDDAKVRAAEERLFGAWEMNWLAYNFGHDLALPGSAGPKIPFLMYPQAETADGRLDSLDPDAFKYSLTAREVTA